MPKVLVLQQLFEGQELIPVTEEPSHIAGNGCGGLYVAFPGERWDVGEGLRQCAKWRAAGGAVAGVVAGAFGCAVLEPEQPGSRILRCQVYTPEGGAGTALPRPHAALALAACPETGAVAVATREEVAVFTKGHDGRWEAAWEIDVPAHCSPLRHVALRGRTLAVASDSEVWCFDTHAPPDDAPPSTQLVEVAFDPSGQCVNRGASPYALQGPVPSLPAGGMLGPTVDPSVRVHEDGAVWGAALLVRAAVAGCVGVSLGPGHVTAAGERGGAVWALAPPSLQWSYTWTAQALAFAAGRLLCVPTRAGLECWTLRAGADLPPAPPDPCLVGLLPLIGVRQVASPSRTCVVAASSVPGGGWNLYLLRLHPARAQARELLSRAADYADNPSVQWQALAEAALLSAEEGLGDEHAQACRMLAAHWLDAQDLVQAGRMWAAAGDGAEAVMAATGQGAAQVDALAGWAQDALRGTVPAPATEGARLAVVSALVQRMPHRLSDALLKWPALRSSPTQAPALAGLGAPPTPLSDMARDAFARCLLRLAAGDEPGAAADALSLDPERLLSLATRDPPQLTAPAPSLGSMLRARAAWVWAEGVVRNGLTLPALDSLPGYPSPDGCVPAWLLGQALLEHVTLHQGGGSGGGGSVDFAGALARLAVLYLRHPESPPASAWDGAFGGKWAAMHQRAYHTLLRWVEARPPSPSAFLSLPTAHRKLLNLLARPDAAQAAAAVASQPDPPPGVAWCALPLLDRLPEALSGVAASSPHELAPYALHFCRTEGDWAAAVEAVMARLGDLPHDVVGRVCGEAASRGGLECVLRCWPEGGSAGYFLALPCMSQLP